MSALKWALWSSWNSIWRRCSEFSVSQDFISDLGKRARRGSESHASRGDSNSVQCLAVGLRSLKLGSSYVIVGNVDRLIAFLNFTF